MVQLTENLNAYCCQTVIIECIKIPFNQGVFSEFSNKLTRSRAIVISCPMAHTALELPAVHTVKVE